MLCIYLLSRQQLRTGKRQWENTALRRTDSSPRILRLRNQGPATGRVCFRLQTLSDFIRASAEHRLGSFSYTDPPPSAGGSTCCPVCTNQKVRAWGVIVSVLHQARQRLGAPNPICWEIRFEGARRASGPYAGDWPDGTPHPKWPISVTTADDSAEPQRRKKRGKEANASLPAATLYVLVLVALSKFILLSSPCRFVASYSMKEVASCLRAFLQLQPLAYRTVPPFSE